MAAAGLTRLCHAFLPLLGRELAIGDSLTQSPNVRNTFVAQLARCRYCGEARSWMFEGKSRLQMFPNRCNRFLPLHCIAPHTAPCIHHLWSLPPPPTIRERIALSPRSLSNTKMGNCTALKHIFMQEFYCSRFRMPKTADFDKVVIRGKHEYV